MLVGLPMYGSLTARNGLKTVSGYLDQHLCFYWVTFAMQLKKTPSLQSLSPRKLDWQFVFINLQGATTTVHVLHYSRDGRILRADSHIHCQ